MTMRREWVARCDEPGCTWQITGQPSLKAADFGEILNDSGWAAAPRVSETFCEEHYRELVAPPPDLAALDRVVQQIAAGVADADRRAARGGA